MSNLFVDKISGKSGTSSGAPITLSGDTVTLGSGAIIDNTVTQTFPAGHVLQVEHTSISSIVTTNSTTYASILSDSITVSAGSKVLVSVFIPVSMGGDSNPGGLQILQTGPASATIMSGTEVMDEHHASSGGFFAGTFLSGVLSSAGTYTFDAQGNRISGSDVTYWVSANPGPGSPSMATMTLMEIA